MTSPISETPLAAYGSIDACSLGANTFEKLIDCSFDGSASTDIESVVLGQLGLSKQPSGFVLAPNAPPRYYDVTIVANFAPRGEVNVKSIGLSNSPTSANVLWGAADSSIPTNTVSPSVVATFKVFLKSSSDGFWIVGAAQNAAQTVNDYKIIIQ